MRPYYDDYSLGWLAARGVEKLQAWCLAPRCGHWGWVRVDALLARMNDHTPLLWIARRLRCEICGRRGCYVQPAREPAPGTPERQAWVRGEIARLQECLQKLEVEVQQWRLVPFPQSLRQPLDGDASEGQ